MLNNYKSLVVVCGPTANTDPMYESFMANVPSGVTIDIVTSASNIGLADKWILESRHVVLVPTELSDAAHIVLTFQNMALINRLFNHLT